MRVAIVSPRIAETTGGTTPKVRLSMLFETTLPLRFWSKVRADESGCWLWTASRYTATGYAQFFINPKMGTGHRYAYQQLVGPVPEGLVLDHLCRVRHCVNPRHLEAVTHRDNILRGNGYTARSAAKTHCVRGHPYSPENTTFYPYRRRCRTCKRAKSVEERANYTPAERAYWAAYKKAWAARHPRRKVS